MKLELCLNIISLEIINAKYTFVIELLGVPVQISVGRCRSSIQSFSTWETSSPYPPNILNIKWLKFIIWANDYHMGLETQPYAELNLLNPLKTILSREVREEEAVQGCDPANFFILSQPVLLLTTDPISCEFCTCRSHNPQYNFFGGQGRCLAKELFGSNPY